MHPQLSGHDNPARGQRPPAVHKHVHGDHDEAATAALQAAVLELTENQMLVNQALVEKIFACERDNEKLRVSEQKLHDLLAHQLANREAERKRISSEIHDTLGQNLLALRIDIVMLYQHTASRQGRLRDWVGAALDNVDTTLRTVKQLMGDLRPAGLELGLLATLEMEVRKFTRASGIVCQLDADAAIAGLVLDEDTLLTVYRVLQECLNNVFRHSLASRVNVRLGTVRETLCMVITDNGIGFEPDAPRKPNSYGLLGLDERVATHGGALAVASTRGQGTEVALELPLAPSRAGRSDAPAIG